MTTLFARLLVLSVVAVVGATASCNPGPTGQACRDKCSLACFGNTDCDIDACGVPRCNQCNAHGYVDYRTDKCICNADRSRSNCEFYLQEASCTNGHPMELLMVQPVYSVCNGTTLVCLNGAVRYSQQPVGELNGQGDVCAAPIISAYTLSISSAGHTYKTTLTNSRVLTLIEDTGVLRDEMVLWFAFVRASQSDDVFTIHSAIDMKRTLGMGVVNGAQVVQVTQEEVKAPLLWFIPGGPTTDSLFTFTRYGRQNTNEFIRASLSTLVLSDQDGLPNQFTLRARNNLITSYSAPGANRTFVEPGNGNLCLSVPNSIVNVTDPTACLTHCHREPTCNAAEWRQSQCWLLTRASGNGLPIADPTARTWNITARPYTDDVASVTAHSCIVPIGGVSCSRPLFGPVRLAQFASPELGNLHANLADQTLGQSARAGVEEKTVSSAFVPLARGWILKTVFGVGSEYHILPQDNSNLALAVSSNSRVYLELVSAITSQTAISWNINGSLAEGQQFTIVVSTRPDLAVMATTSGIFVRRRSSASGSDWSLFTLKVGDSDPYTLTGFGIAEDTTDPTYVFQRSHTLYPADCYGACVRNRRCRGFVYKNSTHSCALFKADLRRPLPAPIAQVGTRLVYMIPSTSPGYLLASPGVCQSYAVSTLMGVTPEPFVYSTPMAKGTFPNQLCLPQSSGSVLIYPALLPGVSITTARESSVVMSEHLTFGRPVAVEPDFAQPPPQFYMAYERQYAHNTLIQPEWRAAAVVLVSTGQPETFHIHLEMCPNRTLEINPATDPSLYGTQRISVGFFDTSQSRPASWRVRGISGFAGLGAGETFVIENAEHSGMLLSSSNGDPASSPMTLSVASSGLVAYQWTFTFHAVSKTPGNGIAASTQFFNNALTRTVATKTADSLFTCLGLAVNYRGVGAINFDTTTDACTLFYLSPQGATTPTPLEPVVVRGVASFQVISAVVGLFVAAHGRIETDASPVACVSDFSQLVTGLPLQNDCYDDHGACIPPVGAKRPFCIDITCTGNWKYNSDAFGCKEHRTRPQVMFIAPLMPQSSSSLGTLDSYGVGDSWILHEVGTSLYHVCRESIISADGTNLAYSETQQCISYDPVTGNLTLVNSPLDHSALLAFVIPINSATATKASSNALLETVVTTNYLKVELRGGSGIGYACFDSAVPLTRTRLARSSDSGGACIAWQVTYREFHSPAMRATNGPFLRAVTATQSMRDVVITEEPQFVMYPSTVLHTYQLEDEDLCRGFLYSNAEAAGYFYTVVDSPVIGLCVIAETIGFASADAGSTQSFVSGYVRTIGKPWRRAGSLSRELIHKSPIPDLGGSGLVDGYGNTNITFAVAPHGNPTGPVSYLANHTITFGFLGCDAISVSGRPCADSLVALYLSRYNDSSGNIAIMMARFGSLTFPTFPLAPYSNAPGQNVFFGDECIIADPYNISPCDYEGVWAYLELQRSVFHHDPLLFWRPIYYDFIYIGDHAYLPFGKPSYEYALRVSAQVPSDYLNGYPFLFGGGLAPRGDLLYPLDGGYLCSYNVTGFNVTSVRVQQVTTATTPLTLSDIPRNCMFQAPYLL